MEVLVWSVSKSVEEWKISYSAGKNANDQDSSLERNTIKMLQSRGKINMT